MEKIYLNLKETNQCHKTGGHRTSDGWVNSYRVSLDYSLTASCANTILPLKACCVFDRIFAQYIGNHDYENDRYGDIDEYCHINNVDISTYINELNLAQNKYIFEQSSDSLSYDAWSLVINSRKEDNKASQIINQCNAELDNEIKSLKEKYRRNILSQTFPHIRNLILEEQLDFMCKYEKLDSYPLDLLAIHNEYDLLIMNILKYSSVPYEKFTEVYTLLTTGKFSYFDILNGTVPQFNKEENFILSKFLGEMEKRYRHDSYQSILSYSPHFPTSLKGLCNLYGHLLNEIGPDKCYKLIDWWEYSTLKEHERSVFSFHSRYLFPYFIIALLAEEKDLETESLFKKYQYHSGFNDVPLIFDERGSYFKNLIPLFNKITQNSNAIEILALILHRSNLSQYERDQIRNREIISCKNNVEKCKIFVNTTLQRFTTNG